MNSIYLHNSLLNMIYSCFTTYYPEYYIGSSFATVFSIAHSSTLSNLRHVCHVLKSGQMPSSVVSKVMSPTSLWHIRFMRNISKQ